MSITYIAISLEILGKIMNMVLIYDLYWTGCCLLTRNITLTVHSIEHDHDRLTCLTIRPTNHL
jgi:hypothetical protein